MRLSTQAFIDQAEAAAADLARVIAYTKATSTGYDERPPGPRTKQLIDRLQQLTASDNPRIFCHHLSPSAPAPVFWCAWAPGKLRCTDCAERAGHRIRGTKEDLRCDSCRRVRTGLGIGVQQTTAVVAEGPSWLSYFPSILIMFGLCRDCLAEDTLEEVAS